MDKVFEIIGWIKIVLSPLITGTLVGAVLYLKFPGALGMMTGILSILIGLVAGILWANRVSKKHGTIHYLSREIASEDFD